MSSLSEENTSFQSKLINVSISSVVKSPKQMKSSDEEPHIVGDGSRAFQACLLVTKSHYISPFMEVNDDKNIIKIYKSTRSGCF